MYQIPCGIWFITCTYYCPHVHHISCKCRVMVTGQVHHQVTMDKALISNCFRHPPHFIEARFTSFKVPRFL